ncbi:hypothetical protein N9Y92_03430 [Chlamydiales bacterium]|nr:hypothetical protein [Chlamydiales bacterium]
MVVIFVLLFSLIGPLYGIEPYLKLEAFLEAPDPWYPGQKGTILYKITYRGQILLLEETLPLLHLDGFEKEGDKTFYEYSENGFSVQEISQNYRASLPDNYLTPPSILKGIRYKVINNEKELIAPLIESKTPPLSVQVSPFPKKNLPGNFNGSIGNYKISLKPLEKKSLRVGDWVVLSFVAEGDDKEGVLTIPNIQFQIGFPGFFIESSLPTDIVKEGNKTYFNVRLTPINTLSKEIPPIEWSQFNPQTKEYQTFKTDPIPIEVIDVTPLTSPIKSTPLLFPKKERRIIPQIPKKTSPDFYVFSNYWLYFLISFILIFFTIQFGFPIMNTYFDKKWKEPLNRLNRIKNPRKLASEWGKFLDAMLKKKRIKKESQEKVQKLIETFNRYCFFSTEGIDLKATINEAKTLLKIIIFILFIPFSVSANENETLSTLLEMEPSKEVYQATSYLLEEMGEIPLAIYYLEKAKRLSPRDIEITKQLSKMRQTYGVPIPPPSLFDKIQPSEWKWMTIIIAFLTLIIFFISKKWAYWGSFITLLLIISIFFTTYFRPKSGIVITASYLYMEPIDNKSTLPFPLLGGEKILIIGIYPGWFKVINQVGEMGFVPQKTIGPL